MPFLSNFQLGLHSWQLCLNHFFLTGSLHSISFMDAVIHSSMSSSGHFSFYYTCLYCRKRSCFGYINELSRLRHEKIVQQSFLRSFGSPRKHLGFHCWWPLVHSQPSAFHHSEVENAKLEANGADNGDLNQVLCHQLGAERSTQMGLIFFNNVWILFNGCICSCFLFTRCLRTQYVFYVWVTSLDTWKEWLESKCLEKHLSLNHCKVKPLLHASSMQNQRVKMPSLDSHIGDD